VVLTPSVPGLTLANQFPPKAGGPQVLKELGEVVLHAGKVQCQRVWV